MNAALISPTMNDTNTEVYTTTMNSEFANDDIICGSFKSCIINCVHTSGCSSIDIDASNALDLTLHCDAQNACSSAKIIYPKTSTYQARANIFCNDYSSSCSSIDFINISPEWTHFDINIVCNDTTSNVCSSLEFRSSGYESSEFGSITDLVSRLLYSNGMYTCDDMDVCPTVQYSGLTVISHCMDSICEIDCTNSGILLYIYNL